MVSLRQVYQTNFAWSILYDGEYRKYNVQLNTVMFVKSEYFYLKLVGFGIFLICAIFVLPNKTNAAPFTCDSGFYQIQNNRLRILNPTDGTYMPIGAQYASNINAIGYNKLDNYIYGIINLPTEAHLFRVDDAGVYTDLGLVTGLPAPDVFGYNSGDMDASGNLYVKDLDQTVYKINVTTNVATALPLSQSMFSSEFVYLNGFLYAVGVGSSSGSFYKIDITNGNVTSLPITLPANGFGSGWAADADTLYFFDNTTGIIYKVTDFNTAPIAIPALATTPSSSNDGASCFTAPSPIPDLVATDKTASTQQNMPLITNAANGVMSGNTGDDISLSSYTQPSHGSIVINPDGSYVYTPNNGYTGTDSFTYTITDSLGNFATASVTITVSPVPVTPAATDSLAPTGNSLQIPFAISLICIVSSLLLAYLVWHVQKHTT